MYKKELRVNNIYGYILQILIIESVIIYIIVYFQR